MPSANPENERLKRDYLHYLKHAKRQSETSLDKAAAAIDDFLAVNAHKSLKRFHREWAVKYRRTLDERTNPHTGKPIAAATIASRLRTIKAFVVWLASQNGYRSKVSYADAEYFNASNTTARIANAKREQATPSLEQVLHVLDTMPMGTLVERRDRALIAFAILTGARDDAIASMRLRHVDLARGRIQQDAREVRTKFRKTFTTRFFPVGDAPLGIVGDWVGELTRTHLFGPDEPLFPKTKVGLDPNGRFGDVALAREPWSDAGPIRRVFRVAFERAGLPYYHPHSFRRTLARLGERVCRTPEEFKAWSQALGHEDVMTTFQAYGTVPEERCDAVFAGLGARGEDDEREAKALRLGLAMMEAGVR